MYNFVPVSKYDQRLNGLSITADKHERLTMSAELKKHLNHNSGDSYFLYFDSEMRTIGISVNGANADHIPHPFDARGYANAKHFLRRCGIDTSVQPVKFIYEGDEKGIMAFRQVGFCLTPSFKSDRNGNLERI
ncbi:hypothetical protein [Brevibacillus formosus]|uniref:hypothetical protein n=1 Tax=Brevibacillus formosus TaxID=54913 RepID=UPI003F1C3608